MGRKQRDSLKRTSGQIFNQLDRAQSDIAKLHTMFVEVHPEKAAALKAMGETLILAENILNAFSIECWAADKDTCLKYIK